MLVKALQLFLIPLLMSLLLDPIDAPIPTPLPLNLPYAHKEYIDAILDEHIVSTRDGGVHCFLVRWRG